MASATSSRSAHAVASPTLLLLLLLLSGLDLPADAARSRIKLINNGYEGLLVAIGEQVPEDARLLDSIKAAFTSASQNLFNATRRRASFREITILVPQSWRSTGVNYLQAKLETFDKANVIVDATEESWQEPPYTRQAAACGQEGEFIHMTPDFLTSPDAIRYFGELGKVIVHEWGHLRWGLLDEYPVTDDIAEHFYVDAREAVQATRCSARIPGTIEHRFGGGPCTSVDPETSLYPEDCRFRPAPGGSSQPGGSYMYYNSLTSIVGFCDNDITNQANLHNFEAPSRHNRLCDGKSSWEIMRNHSDFAGGANPPVALNQSYSTNVTFRVIQRKNYTVVIVMDVSGSMQNYNNLVKLDVAVKNFIRYVIPDGSLVGLVYFESTARKLTTSLEYVNTSDSRESLASLITPTALGGTSIGSGMKAALELLTFNGRDPTGSFMIVISDGQENAAPYISSILPNVKDAGVIIDTLLFTSAADPQLMAMADQTGGLAFFYSGREDSTALTDGLTSTVTSRLQKDTTTTAITVTSRATKLSAQSTLLQQVVIEKDLGSDTRFTFSWSDPAYRLFLTVTKPGNTSQNYTSTSSSNSKTFTFNDTLQVGTWNVAVQNLIAGDAVIAMQVYSKPNPGSQTSPISVEVTTSEETRDFSGALRPLAVFAYVMKDYKAVLHASVFARLESPNGTPIEMQLRDSGSGSDIVKNDGIYSGYFFRPPQIGTYSVRVQVDGTNETTVKTAMTFSRAARAPEPGDKEQILPVTSELAGAFERSTSGDLLTVKSLPPSGKDAYPPARIQDLKIVAARHDVGQVTIEFTAVGDDYDVGRAHHYVLKRSSNYTDLYYDFQNATVVTNDEVVNGNLSKPSEANTLERIVISVEKGTFVSFRIVAVDSANNPGLPSNIVTTKLTSAPIMASTPSNLALIIGLSLAAAILIVGVLITIFMLARRIRNQKKNFKS